MSWRCAKCNHVDRDNDAAICANCGKPNPNRVGSNPFTLEHSSLIKHVVIMNAGSYREELQWTS
jgi:hypothetical protein